MRCNILRRPAFPGGNLKEKQFHIKLSDTMQVCGVEEGVGDERRRKIVRSVCVWMVGGVVVVVVGMFRSFLTAIGQLERDTHIPSAELKGMEWMKFQSLPCRHTLCFAHISTEMFKYSTLSFQPGFPLLYAGIRHGSAVINEKTKPKENGFARICVCTRTLFQHIQMSPFLFLWC